MRFLPFRFFWDKIEIITYLLTLTISPSVMLCKIVVCKEKRTEFYQVKLVSLGTTVVKKEFLHVPWALIIYQT